MSASRTLVRSFVVCLSIGSMLVGASTNALAQEPLASRAIQTGATLDSISAMPSTSPRPAALMPLWVGFAALQALDMQSTFKGLQTGGREANPVAGTFIGSGVGFASMKIATAGAVIYLTNRVQKHNRAAAILTMVALDSAYAFVVAHNYSVQQR
jgi:hypothetical protein